MADFQNWEKMQLRAFTVWVNDKLRETGLVVKDITADLNDGVVLCALAQELTGVRIKPERGAKDDVHKLQNISKAIEALRAHDLAKNVSGHDVLHGERRPILGMIWAAVQKDMRNCGIGESEKASKDALLFWVKKNTEGYPGVNVKNFTTSFQDGRALCALINKFRPENLKYSGREFPSEEHSDGENTALACQVMEDTFACCENVLGIPRILAAEDLADLSAKPDEKSVITYISMIYKKVLESRGLRDAAQIVNRAIDTKRVNDEQKERYEKEVSVMKNQLSNWIADLGQKGKKKTLPELERDLGEFKQFMSGERVDLVKRRGNCDALLAAIQTKARLEKRPAYSPPAGLSTSDVNAAWGLAAEKEKEIYEDLISKIREQQDALCKEYADQAHALSALCTDLDHQLTRDADGNTSTNDQIYHLGYIKDALSTDAADRLRNLSLLNEKMQAAKIRQNKFTDITQMGLELQVEQTQVNCNKKEYELERKKAAEENDNLTPEELASLKESFDYFDKDKSDALDRLEFKSALGSLGLDLGSDSDLDRAMDEADTDRSKTIGFTEFANFMKKKLHGRGGVNELIAAFKDICDGRTEVSLTDLKSFVDPITDDNIAYIMNKAPAGGGTEARNYTVFSQMCYQDKYTMPELARIVN